MGLLIRCAEKCSGANPVVPLALVPIVVMVHRHKEIDLLAGFAYICSTMT
jgi:hypothetical protein